MASTPDRDKVELSTARLLALGDGIFAIAMTLLVFEIKVPGGGEPLRQQLWLLWPKFASCGLSFLTLGFSWIGHHNQYAVIRRTDRPFLWINVAFFFFIAMVPFASALLGEHPFDPAAVLAYAGILAASGATLYCHWRYAAAGARLIDADISPEFIAQTGRRVLIAPVAYLAVMGLAFVSTGVSLVLCLLIPVYFMVPGRVDRFWKRA
jgi:uncharacterized membrane protein